MKTIKFVDPENFEESEQQFDEFHYELAEEIREFISNKFKYVTPVISNKEANKLMVGTMKGRTPGDVAEKFRITIEKIV